MVNGGVRFFFFCFLRSENEARTAVRCLVRQTKDFVDKNDQRSGRSIDFGAHTAPCRRANIMQHNVIGGLLCSFFFSPRPVA